jgi:hypothetical protein
MHVVAAVVKEEAFRANEYDEAAAAVGTIMPKR